MRLSGTSLKQTVHTHRACVHQTTKLVAALLRVARVTVGLVEIMAAYHWVYDSRHLQGDCKELGSAPHPMLFYWVWATFSFFSHGISRRPEPQAKAKAKTKKLIFQARTNKRDCMLRCLEISFTRKITCLVNMHKTANRPVSRQR